MMNDHLENFADNNDDDDNDDDRCCRSQIRNAQGLNTDVRSTETIQITETSDKHRKDA